MKTRKELDVEWMNAAFAIRRGESPDLSALLSAERTVVDRQVATRAIRFAATWTSGGRAVLEDLANRLERGEIEIPEPRK